MRLISDMVESIMLVALRWEDYRNITPTDLGQDCPVVYVEGYKHIGGTNEYLENVVHGVRLVFGDGFKLIFQPHPNEPGPQNSEDKILLGDRNSLLRNTPTIPAPKGLRSVDFTVSSDIVVHTSGAMGVPVVAMNEKRAFYWNSAFIRERMRKQVGEESWFPVAQGVIWEVNSPDELAEGIKSLEDDVAWEDIKLAQEQLCPLDERNIADQVIDYLLELAND